MPEVYLGYHSMVYQKYRGYNAFKRGEPDEIFVTFLEDLPTEHNLSAGVQNALYYKIHEDINIGLVLKISASARIINGRQVIEIIDAHDNLYGDSSAEVDRKRVEFHQNTTMGISLRYKMHRK